VSLYVRLYVTFFSHRKTRQLRSVIGDAAFSKYSDDDIAEFIGYRGDAPAMVKALVDVGFLDVDGKIHDWVEHAGYHEFYAARARRAANAKWKKAKAYAKAESNGTPVSSDSRAELIPGADLKRAKQCLKQSSSNA
jgi:hypothetical protein